MGSVEKTITIAGEGFKNVTSNRRYRTVQNIKIKVLWDKA